MKRPSQSLFPPELEGPARNCRPWFKVSTGIIHDPDLYALPAEVERTYWRLAACVAAYGTADQTPYEDQVIAHACSRDLRTFRRHVDTLVNAGFVERMDVGLRIPAFFKYNPTRTDAERKADERRRKRRARENVTGHVTGHCAQVSRTMSRSRSKSIDITNNRCSIEEHSTSRATAPTSSSSSKSRPRYSQKEIAKQARSAFHEVLHACSMFGSQHAAKRARWTRAIIPDLVNICGGFLEFGRATGDQRNALEQRFVRLYIDKASGDQSHAQT